MTGTADPATRPAYERLAARIRTQIENGQLAPGDRLPSELALATEAAMSRSTVREALRTLQEAGFVERASPRIMIVCRQESEPAHLQLTRVLRRHNLTFERLHEALVILDPALSRLAAERADAADLLELEQILTAQDETLFDYAEWNRLDQEFHMTIAEIADNQALLLARAPVSRIINPALFDFVTNQKATQAASRWHHRILDEIANGDGEAAALMTRRHVDDFRSAWVAAGRELSQVIEPDEQDT
jgi:GntR family transcriptional regulator, transcriptional repressor for pyruvate dehydrogenase complex